MLLIFYLGENIFYRIRLYEQYKFEVEQFSVIEEKIVSKLNDSEYDFYFNDNIILGKIKLNEAQKTWRKLFGIENEKLKEMADKVVFWKKTLDKSVISGDFND